MHELAFQLGMTVQDVADTMTYDELLKWVKYFERRPVGWREDNRMFKLIQTVQGLAGSSKMKPWDIFPSLYPIYNENRDASKGTNMSTFKQSALFSKIMRAKGGEHLNVS